MKHLSDNRGHHRGFPIAFLIFAITQHFSIACAVRFVSGRRRFFHGRKAGHAPAFFEGRALAYAAPGFATSGFAAFAFAGGLT
jgi:hypothetical protein